MGGINFTKRGHILQASVPKIGTYGAAVYLCDDPDGMAPRTGRRWRIARFKPGCTRRHVHERAGNYGVGALEGNSQWRVGF